MQPGSADAQKAKAKTPQNRMCFLPGSDAPAHNGLVGGSNPPGPTTQSHRSSNFLETRG